MSEMYPELSTFDARPDQRLDRHLAGVADNVFQLVPSARTNASGNSWRSTSAYGDSWRAVGRVLAWTHDAGKLTLWFQTYLDTGDRSSTGAPTDRHVDHGFVSALLTAHALYAIDASDEIIVAGFYAVAKHHGVLPNIRNTHSEYAGTARSERKRQRYRTAADQLEEIDATAAAAADELLDEATAGALEWSDIHVDQPDVYQNLLSDPRSFDGRFYETVLRAWSTVVCADKLDAAGIRLAEQPIERPSLKALRGHTRDFPDGETLLERELNEHRSTAHAVAWRTLQDRFEAGQRLFRLTLPTGFGKTLTGLRAGLELAQQRDGRVIYALPYTSIIDQVDDVCQSIFDVDRDSPAYTVHHHLADTRTTLGENPDENVSNGSETTFAETWQAGLVLTTFTQLFESIAGPTNTQSMKLPALQDSTIIIDEPQALSHDWWGLFRRTVRFLIDEYDSTVVLMTATQPRLLEQDSSVRSPAPLTSEFDSCVEFLEDNPRVEFRLHESLDRYLSGEQTSSVAMTDAAATLTSETTGGSNTLAIVNTIESAATLTEAVDEHPSDETLSLASDLIAYRTAHETETLPTDQLAAAYLDYLEDRKSVSPATTLVSTLTTRIRPTDRAILLASLRRILDPETDTPFDENPTITISTQLIEAGVDLSFDKLYRDYAPVPALVQAAGRCNRSFDGSTSPVTVWRLAGPREHSTTPSHLIYGQKSLLRPTRIALDSVREDGQTAIPEATLISTGVDTYYETLHEQRRTEDRHDDLVAQFDNAAGERLRMASLIDESYETRDFAVLLTEADLQSYDTLQKARDKGNWRCASKAFDVLKPLVVTIPVTNPKTKTEPITPINLVDYPEKYEIETGRGFVAEGNITAIEK